MLRGIHIRVNILDTFANIVHQVNPSSTLEVGCNVGNELKLIPDFARLGVDLERKKVKKLKKLNISLKKMSIAGIVADGNFLPFREGSFDLVYTFGCLSHNKSIKLLIDELLRVSGKYVLNIEWIGSKVSPSNYGNCKQNTWIHDYENFWAVKDCQVCFNRKVVDGSDLYHVLLVKKDFVKKVVVDKETPKVLEDKDLLFFKLGKFTFRLGRSK